MDINIALQLLANEAEDHQKKVDTFTMAQEVLRTTFDPQFKQLDAANAQIADLQTQLADTKTELATTKGQLETFTFQNQITPPINEQKI